MVMEGKTLRKGEFKMRVDMLDSFTST